MTLILMSLVSLSVYSEESTAAELALRYRMLSQDFTSAPQNLDQVFASFESVSSFSNRSLETLSADPEFLKSIQSFSQSLNTLLNSLPTDAQRKESLESIITLFSEKFPTLEKESIGSIHALYRMHLDSLLKSNVPTSGNANNSGVSFKGIKVKGNEVVKTIGTYGFWGFWFVTSTWALVQLSPNVENFMYYPAFAMFIASGPFSISNQIWTQVFDRIEKRAALKHQTALEYMKDRVRGLKHRWSLSKPKSQLICAQYYN